MVPAPLRFSTANGRPRRILAFVPGQLMMIRSPLLRNFCRRRRSAFQRRHAQPAGVYFIRCDDRQFTGYHVQSHEYDLGSPLCACHSHLQVHVFNVRRTLLDDETPSLLKEPFRQVGAIRLCYADAIAGAAEPLAKVGRQHVAMLGETTSGLRFQFLPLQGDVRCGQGSRNIQLLAWYVDAPNR